MLSAIDSNIAIYGFADFSDASKTRVARELFERLATTEECMISTQVLKEFASVCTKKLRPAMPQDILLARLQQLARLPTVVVDVAMTISAVRRHFTSQVSFYDALVIEAAIAGGARILYSEDLRHGQIFDTVEIVNPFL